MLRRILFESLIICVMTVIFLLFCATVGISTSTPPTSPPAEAALESNIAIEDLVTEGDDVRNLETIPIPPSVD